MIRLSDERAEIRGRHHARGRYCDSCHGLWPCEVIRTLDALDVAEAVLRKMVYRYGRYDDAMVEACRLLDVEVP